MVILLYYPKGIVFSLYRVIYYGKMEAGVGKKFDFPGGGGGEGGGATPYPNIYNVLFFMTLAY
jgi:hypothetical protein